MLSTVALSEWLIRSTYAAAHQDDAHTYYLKAASGVRYLAEPMGSAFDLAVKASMALLVIGIASAAILAASKTDAKANQA